MRGSLIAAGALLGAALILSTSWSLSVNAQPKAEPKAATKPSPKGAPKPGERTTTTACPYAGANPTCLMINGADGTVYNITGTNPRPRLTGRMIRLRGTVTDKLSMCAQGIVLERVRWTRTRQRCPN